MYTITDKGRLSNETGVHEIPFTGTTPTGGYLNYENNILKTGCITMEEHKVNIEDGEITAVEKGKCQSISLTACDSINFNPSPEEWFNFDSSTGTITGFSNSWNGTTDITIPCQIGGVDVVNIGDGNSGVFVSKNLTSVVISDNVITIGKEAFAANQLTNLTLGNNLQSIGTYAFVGNKLINVDIPNSVINIGDMAFERNQIENVKFGSNLKTISQYAFNMNKLKSVDIPNSVETIGSTAFGINEIETLKLGEKITSIDDFAFTGNKLTEVTIPSSVTHIGRSVFPKSIAHSTNPNLTRIINLTGKKFDWNKIITGTSGEEFETGTLELSDGNVEITKSN